jgi:alpha-glucosidase (family GH31 glycosyl hydrolase)
MDYWTKEIQTGPQWLEIEAPLDQIPLWVRAGAILPLGPDLDYVEQGPLDPLSLDIYLPQGRSETVVRLEDRPDIPVHYTLEGKTLEVEIGAAPGKAAVAVHGVQPVTATLDGQSLDLDSRTGAKTVTFCATSSTRLVFLLGD